MNFRAMFWLFAAIGLALLWFWLFVARADAFDNVGAWEVAAEHYGTPCGGAVAFQWGHLGPGVNARSEWRYPKGGDPRDASTYFDCSITWSLDVDWTPAKFCTVTEHEDGHLMGHVHGDDAIMAPFYDGPSPECVAATTIPPPSWRNAALDRPRPPQYSARIRSTTRRTPHEARSHQMGLGRLQGPRHP